MRNKWIIIAVITAAFIAFLIWLFIESSKPLPGQKISDLGRDHVPVGEKVEYNSNPPTSGNHYADWIRAGVYSEPKDDRNLVHSLEHGYVILNFKCQISNGKSNFSNFKTEEATESAEEKQECEGRKKQLEGVYNKKGKRKLIVVPRENLETNFAISAWTYLDKFDQLDTARIEKFIDAHRDQGPERTME